MITWVSREEWGALPPTRVVRLRGPVPEVFIHHTVTGQMDTNGVVDPIMRSVQRWHMTGRGWTDIAYNYLIDVSGRVFVGRGLNRGGATRGRNSKSVAICLIGNYEKDEVTDGQFGAVTDLINWLIGNGTLESNPDVRMHRDVKNTACPGSNTAERMFPGGEFHYGFATTDPPPGPPVWDYPGTVIGMGRFSESIEIRLVQTALQMHGHDPGPLDGQFGPKTTRAVKRFQRAAGLTSDGLVGRQTWAALFGAQT